MMRTKLEEFDCATLPKAVESSRMFQMETISVRHRRPEEVQPDLVTLTKDKFDLTQSDAYRLPLGTVTLVGFVMLLVTSSRLACPSHHTTGPTHGAAKAMQMDGLPTTACRV